MIFLTPALQVTLGLFDTSFDASGTALLLGTFNLFFIIGAILYLIFAFIVIRQIAIMRKTLITEFSSLFTTLGYAHFVAALLVLVLFWLIL